MKPAPTNNQNSLGRNKKYCHCIVQRPVTLPPVSLCRSCLADQILQLEASGNYHRPWKFTVKPNGRLVRVSSTPYGASTSRLSTSSSSRSLLDPKRVGNPYLGDGLALRCFQRLSSPNIATLRCPWQDSRHTSGSSLPALSY